MRLDRHFTDESVCILAGQGFWRLRWPCEAECVFMLCSFLVHERKVLNQNRVTD